MGGGLSLSLPEDMVLGDDGIPWVQGWDLVFDHGTYPVYLINLFNLVSDLKWAKTDILTS